MPPPDVGARLGLDVVRQRLRIVVGDEHDLGSSSAPTRRTCEESSPSAEAVRSLPVPPAAVHALSPAALLRSNTDADHVHASSFVLTIVPWVSSVDTVTAV